MPTKVAPKIDIVESVRDDGVCFARVRCAELPAGMSCVIRKHGSGWVRRTQAFGSGSVRYHSHASLTAAYEAARKWVRRKVAEERRHDWVVIVDRSAGLFWSNNDGWVSLSDATHFVAADIPRLRVPVAGEWITLRDANDIEGKRQKEDAR